MEACATAHHWARELTALGHTVKLMPPAYVKDAGLTATLWRGHGRHPKSPQQHDPQAATWRTSSCSVKPALRPVFVQLRNASAGAVLVPPRGAATDAASTRSTQDPDRAGFSQVPAAKWVSMWQRAITLPDEICGPMGKAVLDELVARGLAVKAPTSHPNRSF
jgi:hypothetical protein